MKTRLTLALGVSSLTLALIYSMLGQLTITYQLTIFLALLAGLTLSIAGALVATIVKENN